jgi:uncharacterized membrane protein YcaP (DUF421 family)
MNPWALFLRCVLVYGILLGTLRLAGKRTIRQANAADFVFALVLGDLVDDVVWREVPVSQFTVALSTLVMVKLGVMHLAWRRGSRG